MTTEYSSHFPVNVQPFSSSEPTAWFLSFPPHLEKGASSASEEVTAPFCPVELGDCQNANTKRNCLSSGESSVSENALVFEGRVAFSENQDSKDHRYENPCSTVCTSGDKSDDYLSFLGLDTISNNDPGFHQDVERLRELLVCSLRPPRSPEPPSPTLEAPTPDNPSWWEQQTATITAATPILCNDVLENAVSMQKAQQHLISLNCLRPEQGVQVPSLTAEHQLYHDISSPNIQEKWISEGFFLDQNIPSSLSAIAEKLEPLPTQEHVPYDIPSSENTSSQGSSREPEINSSLCSDHVLAAVRAQQRRQFFKTRLCPHHFSYRGACRKKNRCSYAHSEAELRPSINLTKTKLCHKYSLGLCDDIDCSFAHGLSELKFTPSFFKSQICKFWRAGDCPLGGSCRHAHGENDRLWSATTTSSLAGLIDTQATK